MDRSDSSPASSGQGDGPAAASLLLVDDHPVVRAGLADMLSREPDMHVAGQAETAEQALEMLDHVDPDIVIVDYRLPGMDGVELCREIARRTVRPSVVILSAFLDDDAVYGAIAAGARAYVVKDIDAAELKAAIRAAVRGQTSIDSKVTARMIRWARSADRAGPVAELRPSELRVLRLLCQGKSPAEITAMTQLRPQTVKSYLRSIYLKLGVRTRGEAVALALRRGMCC